MKITTQTAQTNEFELTGDIIRAIVRKNFPQFCPEGAEIKVQFKVPSGGDYSGMLLDLDDETFVTVTVSSVSNGNG